MLSTEGQGLAFDGGHALIALHIRALIDGHDEQTIAQEALGPRTHKAGADLGHAISVITAVAAQAPDRVIVGHHIAHRTIALSLHDQPSIKLQARADQSRKGAGLAQQIGHRFGIVMAGQDVVDHLAHAGNTAAHGLTLDLEGGDKIVGGTGGFSGGEVGHDRYIGRSGSKCEPSAAFPIQWPQSTKPERPSVHGCGSRPRQRPWTEAHQ